MNILITGANGFIGKNLSVTLENIKNGNDKTRKKSIIIDDIFLCDRETSEIELEEFAKKVDFVFHLAGVNRPKDNSEFKKGNVDFTEKLLGLLKKYDKHAPIVFSSSIQASQTGRYKDSEYAKTKHEGEEILKKYKQETGSKIIIYRFPNLFGKWCRPNYNSVVATFCHNIAHDLSIQINDPNTILEMAYIDDVIDELISCLCNEESYKDGYAYVPTTYEVTLKEIVDYLNEFKSYDNTLFLTDLKPDSFKKKLYSTYLSYLPKDKAIVTLKMNKDDRGSFTELFKTIDFGQFSINISKPGITKGNHFHHSKWEYFIVVSGKALIQERNIITDELYEYEVSGEDIKAVYMLPGYTHNIINLSDTDNLVTVMWANEVFDKDRPDTYFEKVKQ